MPPMFDIGGPMEARRKELVPPMFNVRERVATEVGFPLTAAVHIPFHWDSTNQQMIQCHKERDGVADCCRRLGPAKDYVFAPIVNYETNEVSIWRMPVGTFSRVQEIYREFGERGGIGEGGVPDVRVARNDEVFRGPDVTVIPRKPRWKEDSTRWTLACQDALKIYRSDVLGERDDKPPTRIELLFSD